MGYALDKKATNELAEYVRYLDGDILGKIIWKNLCVSVLGLSLDAINIPIGRFGDIGTEDRNMTDAVVQFKGDEIGIEIKCARINIANRTLGRTKENWAFGKIRHLSNDDESPWQILAAIGIKSLGLEDSQHWDYMGRMCKDTKGSPNEVIIDALPHHPEFLRLCGVFLIPRAALEASYFRVNLEAIPKSRYGKYFALGYEHNRLRQLWHQCVATK